MGFTPPFVPAHREVKHMRVRKGLALGVVVLAGVLVLSVVVLGVLSSVAKATSTAASTDSDATSGNNTTSNSTGVPPGGHPCTNMTAASSDSALELVRSPA
jgi:hypothetical protein